MADAFRELYAGAVGANVTVVALVPAKDRADSVAATVQALTELDEVDEVLVVDDGSVDDTAAVAAAAGARVLRLPANVGKGGAVRAGIDATPEADVYLLIDADLGSTAARSQALLPPVLSGQADMSIAVLPSAGGRGGFGAVRRLAAAGVLRATGQPTRAPLSGQRAVLAPLLRSLTLGARFGLETAMTIDARRAGARVVEVDLDMDHRHTGRSLAGFGHRARQGLDVARALWPRLTSGTQRVGAILVAFGVLMGAMIWSGSRWEPSSVAPSERPSKVVIFGAPKLGWEDIGTGAMPHLDTLLERGAVAATSVRTIAGRPSTTEGYATVGAGTRVRATADAGAAFDVDTPLEGSTAGQALSRRTGTEPLGQVVVVGAPPTIRLNEGRHLSSAPGALGDALGRARLRTAVVGNADTGVADLPRRPPLVRPAGAALMDSNGSVDFGTVDASLLVSDPGAPFGFRSDPEAMTDAVLSALLKADVIVVDSGDLERAAEFVAVSTPAQGARARRAALRATDDLLGEVASAAGPDALLLVVSVAPPSKRWHLTPMVASGAGVEPGYIHSLSTKRLGVVTLTDLAPTVLAALGAPVPEGMIGHSLRYHPGDIDLDRLRRIDRDAAVREAIYFRLTVTYIFIQAVVYLLAALAFSRLGGAGRAGAALRWTVLAVSAWPLATFVLRAVPDIGALGSGAVPVLLAIDAGIVAVALRARRRPLAPLAWVCGATVLLLVLDVATGARLQTSSLLGYSLHTAARFTGFGNTAFATLASTTIIAVALHVHHAPRRREALVTAACIFALVVVADGAPSLGADVGGILTLVPVFGLTLLALSGRRMSLRAVAIAAAVTLAALVVATGIDLLRPVDSRTHLGTLVTRVSEQGLEPLTTTVNRKVAANMRTFRSPWTWTIPIVALYMLSVLGFGRGWSRLLPPRSAVRAAVVGVLAAGLLGYAVNDSGVVVTALVFVYIGPFLTLLALQRDAAPLTLDHLGTGLPALRPPGVGVTSP
ncbi:MAG TPA: glycosyltransferase [Acidimicrobiales bacterium]|nr:glycosyltransferase [Acidimicrobiales bacterium]